MPKKRDRLPWQTIATLPIFVFVSLMQVGSVHSQGSSDILRQFDGLWTAEWVAETGGSKLEQVLFYRNALDRHTAALPFFPGLAAVTLCQGQGCGGADIVVSGTGFDCRYAYSIYNQNEFAWTYKGGQGGCPPSAKFARVRPPSQPEEKVTAAPSPAPARIPAPVEPPPREPPVTIAPASPRGSYWEFAGSLVRLEADPDKPPRRFYFFEPSAQMIASGAHAGDLLFFGQRSGNSYEGTAYVFAGKCGKHPYRTVGNVSDDDQTISLSGRKPVINGSCQIIGYEAARLDLRYQFRVN